MTPPAPAASAAPSPVHPRHRAPARRRRWALGLLLALAALLAACEFLGWPFLRQPLQNLLAERLQRDVTVGEPFRLRLIGGVRVQAESFVIGAPRWAATEAQRRPLVEAQGADLRLPYRTLLRGSGNGAQAWEIDSLEVQQIAARLWRNGEGRNNWQFSPEGEDSGAGATPEFGQLLVHRGEISYADQPLAMQLQARASTREGEGQANAPGLSVEGDGTYAEAAFEFKATADGLMPLLARDGRSKDVPLTLEARSRQANFSFEGQAQDVFRLSGLKGRFSASGPSLAAFGEPLGLTLPSTARFSVGGRLRREGEVWSVQVAALSVGESRLAGEFRYDASNEPPMLSGELRGRRLLLADLGPAFGGGPAGARDTTPQQGKASAASGRLLPQREFDLPSLQRMNADVRVDLQSLDLGTPALGDLSPLRGRIRLEDSVLRMSDMVATASEGEVRGQLQLDARRTEPRWEADLRWDGVRLEQWLTVRNQRAAEAGHPPHYVSGRLAGRTTLQGTGRSTAAVLASLTGTTSMWVRQGALSHLLIEALGVDIAQGLGLLITGDQPLPMACAVLRMTAENGLVKTDAGVIDTPDSTLLVSGVVSLADEQLGLRLTTRPKDFTPLSLRAPILLRGSFTEPQVSLDTKAIGLKGLAALALAAVNPLAALIPLVDPGEAEGQGCQAALQRLRGTGAR